MGGILVKEQRQKQQVETIKKTIHKKKAYYLS